MRNKILKEIYSWHRYETLMFITYMNTDISIRKLAKETKISKDSIFYTLKKCKNKLKESYGDDWQDFVKEDFYKLNKQYG